MDIEMPESPGGADQELEAELHHAVWVSCPYCGESGDLVVDPGGGAIQEYVEDCAVCCKPWLVLVKLNGEGEPSVSVATLDDE